MALSTRESRPPSPALSPEAVEFGAALRAMRVAQGSDLAEVAQLLRIRQVFLQAIEDGRFRDMPGPTYASGFIRAYADFLGLDVPEVMRRYREVTGPSGGMTQGALVPPSPVVEGRTPTGSILLVGAVLAAIVYGGWYYMTVHGRDAGAVVSGLPKQIAEMVGMNRDAAVSPSGATPPRSQVPASATAPVPAPGTAPDTAPGPAAAPPAPEEKPAAKPEPSAQATPSEPKPAASSGQAATDKTASATTPEPATTPEVDAPLPVPRPKRLPKPAASEPGEPAQTPAVATREAAPATEPAVPASAPTKPARASTAAAEPSAPPPAQPAAKKPIPKESAAAAPSAGKTAPSAPPAAAAVAVAAAAEPAAAKPAAAEGVPAAPPAEPAPVQTPAANAPTPAAPQVAAVSPAAAGDGRVVLRAAAASWVELRDPDDRRVFSRLMRAGETYTVPLGKAVKLTTGNAGGLDILVDGKAVPSLGPVGAVRRDISLDPDSLLARLHQ